MAQQAQVAGFEAEAIFAIELAVGETLANIVEHAYDGQEGCEIHIDLSIDSAKLSVTIRDFGRKFDTRNYSPPNPDIPSEKGGYGVFLIQEMMDEVIYDTSLSQGTQINLVKYRSRGSHG